MSAEYTQVQTRAVEFVQALVANNEVIEFGPAVDIMGIGTYAEPGMRARVVKFDPTDGGLLIVSYKGFEDYNKPLETSNYNDRDGRPGLTAREAGYYKEQERICTDLDNISAQIHPVAAHTSALMGVYKDSGTTRPYAAWVEEMACNHLGIAIDPATSTAKSPTAQGDMAAEQDVASRGPGL